MMERMARKMVLIAETILALYGLLCVGCVLYTKIFNRYAGVDLSDPLNCALFGMMIIVALAAPWKIVEVFNELRRS